MKTLHKTDMEWKKIDSYKTFSHGFEYWLEKEILDNRDLAWDINFNIKYRILTPVRHTISPVKYLLLCKNTENENT